MRVINRRTENKTVGLLGFGNNPVYDIVVKNTTTVAVFAAFAAAYAIAQRAGTALDNFGFDPFCLLYTS